MGRIAWLWRSLFRQRQADEALDAELRACLEMTAEQKMEAGLTEAEAWRQARLEMGGVEQVKEAVRDVRAGAWLAALAMDLRYAVRSLRAGAGFAGVTLAVLSIGLGAGGAMFGLYDVLLRNPYRFPAAERMVELQAVHASGKNSGTGFADYLDWRTGSSSFEEMAIAPWVGSATVEGSGELRRVNVCSTTASFFRLWGVQPMVGRAFLEGEDRPGGARVVLLSAEEWTRRYGRSHALPANPVPIDEIPHEVIGAMPESFRFPGMKACDYWTPLRGSQSTGRFQHQFGVWARLKPGVTVERAQADMTAVAQRLAWAFPESNRDWGVKVRLVAEALAEYVRGPLAMMGAGVGFVLLLVCVNVAGLLLARGSARSGEMAIRASLGAGRGRLLRQMLTESAVLGVLGGIGGVAVAAAGMRVFAAAAPEESGLQGILELNGRVAGFTMALALGTSLVFGIVPALHGTGVDWNARLKGGRGQDGKRVRWLSGLVAGEVALSLLLLGSVGVLAEGMRTALRRDLGLRAEGVVTFALDPPGKRYTPEAALRLFDDLLAKLQQDARVISAGAVATLPMTGGYSGTGYEVEGRAAPRDWVQQMTQINAATPDYFRAMGIRLLRGRPFNARDKEDSPKVAIVDETFAGKAFGQENPVGRRIRFHHGEWMTVVAVAGAIRHQAPTNDPVPQVYRPWRQDGGVQWVAILSRASTREAAALARRCVSELDRGLPVLRLRTMNEVVSDSMALPRTLTGTGALAAGFALVLSAMGLFGLVAYSVAQRRKELSIRMALGATPAEVVAMVARRGVRLAGIGAAVGFPGALAAGRLLYAELRWVNSWSPGVLAAACVSLLGVAWAASYWPARQAARLDPARGLREE